MSNLETRPEETACGGLEEAAPSPVLELLVPRDVPLGGVRAMRVRRTLPHRDLRMVGPWCFVDYYGPDRVAGTAGMQVPPHPHCGLQTVSWLLEGDVLHRDSVGSEQLIRPGELNLMTAGWGIAHSEQSPRAHAPVLHGVQLWVALPDGSRNGDAAFEHDADLPTITSRGAAVTVIMGELAGTVSPARTFSPLVGADLRLDANAELEIPLDPEFEHAVLAVSDGIEVQQMPTERSAMLYLGAGRDVVTITARDEPGRALLLGGEPFAEELLMWWNFVGRSHDEIVAARAAWQAGERFGAVTAYDGDRLAAPDLPTTPLKPRPRRRRPT